MGIERMCEERLVRPANTPPHLFRPSSTYCVTAKTLNGQLIIASDLRKIQVVEALDYACRQRSWKMIAWVVLANHYHCILEAPEVGADQLSQLIGSVHRFTARIWNAEDNQSGRVIWYRYWDTCLTSAGSFYARLNYIHHNPVKHGLTPDPYTYSFSSYRQWLERDDVPALENAYPWERLDLE